MVNFAHPLSMADALLRIDLAQYRGVCLLQGIALCHE